MGQLSHAGIYLVQTLVSLYLLAVLLRFFLQLVRADFYNPVSQFVVKVTDPLLRPLRRLIPGFGGVDLAALVLALLVQGVAIALILSLAGAPLPNPLLILLWSLVGLVGLTIKIFFVALLLHLALPIRYPRVTPEQVLRAMSTDKKRVGARLRFVLPRAIGDADMFDDVEEEAVLATLAEIASPDLP